MNYWLAKTEPEEYSWQDLVKDKQAPWDGVRNYQARNNLKQMKLNDPVIIYHSGITPSAVGIARVAKMADADPSDEQWVQIDLTPETPLPHPVPLSKLKIDPVFTQCLLIRQPRLSVVPLTKTQFQQIKSLGLSPS